LITAVVGIQLWQSINRTRLDGNDGGPGGGAGPSVKARTPPLGGWSPGGGACSAVPSPAPALPIWLGPLEGKAWADPPSTPIWCWSARANPDARLRTTRGPAGRGRGAEVLPFAWRSGMAVGQRTCAAHGPGPRPMPHPRTALEALLRLIPGSDSARLASELGEAGASYCCQAADLMAPPSALWGSQATTSPATGRWPCCSAISAKAIALLDHLGDGREPPLRIVAALTARSAAGSGVSLLGGPGGSRTGL